MMHGVFIGKQRVGSVLGPFAGEPRKTKWCAYASHDRKQGFPTRKAAIAWLYELARTEGKDAFGNPLARQP